MGYNLRRHKINGAPFPYLALERGELPRQRRQRGCLLLLLQGRRLRGRQLFAQRQGFTPERLNRSQSLRLL